MGRPRPISRPWSRTGENPPYGILGGTMETSASFEARSAPSSYPTTKKPLVNAGICGGARESCAKSDWLVERGGFEPPRPFDFALV